MTRSEALIHLAAGVLAGPISDDYDDQLPEVTAANAAWQTLKTLERRHGLTFDPEPPTPIEQGRAAS